MGRTLPTRSFSILYAKFLNLTTTQKTWFQATALPDLDDTFSPGAPSWAPIGGTNFPALNDDDDFDFDALATAPALHLGGGGELGEFERAASAFPALDGDEGTSGPSLEAGLSQFESQSFHATPQTPSSFQSPAPAQFQSPAPRGGNHSAFRQPEQPEPEVVRCVLYVYWSNKYQSLWDRQSREHLAEKIAQRDEDSKKKREETIARAEREIDKFYEQYNAKEKTILANNQVPLPYRLSLLRHNLVSYLRFGGFRTPQSETVGRAGIDLIRYREVLLKLRKHVQLGTINKD